jgi:hypothetical protein
MHYPSTHKVVHRVTQRDNLVRQGLVLLPRRLHLCLGGLMDAVESSRHARWQIRQATTIDEEATVSE